MGETAKIAGRAPIPVEVEEGKLYWWCTCGHSLKQPFCDGSHKDTEFAPQGWEAPKSGTVFFCACKHSNNGPLCDGSHSSLD
ncbi:MAG: CDGSH iron-sulfur domain-containing protein [Pseudomonadota bacterium]